MHLKKRSLLFLLIAALGCGSVGGQVRSERKYQRTDAEAQKIVRDVLKVSPIIDGHSDLFAWYFGCVYKKLPKCPQTLEDYPIDKITNGQTDIPRWRKGGVGGSQMNVFGSDVFSATVESNFVNLLEKTYPNDLKVVATAAEMRQAMRAGKIALLPMMEGSERLAGDISQLDALYKLNLRCMTFTYVTGPFSDASDDEPRNNGITNAGKELVKKMNELGIIIDMSHISAKAMSDILDTTRAPVIFSHSNARAVADVERNVPDTILLRLKSNKGLIMIDMVAEHTTTAFGKWMKEGDDLYFATKKKSPDDKDLLKKVMTEWEEKNPMPVPKLVDVADHFDHVKNLIGVDHIGISGDYDGMEYPIPGLDDVSKFPDLLIELARRDWTEKELRKITSENFLRVFEAVEKSAKDLKRIK
ncbi:dipeptidase [soil metagenome]